MIKICCFSVKKPGDDEKLTKEVLLGALKEEYQDFESELKILKIQEGANNAFNEKAEFELKAGENLKLFYKGLLGAPKEIKTQRDVDEAMKFEHADPDMSGMPNVLRIFVQETKSKGNYNTIVE